MTKTDGNLHSERMKRAHECLEGLACGDAFGERFFLPPDIAVPMIKRRAVPAPPWFFTDDTMMAISVVAVLEKYGEIDPDYLARDFANRYDSSRGYGPAMHNLLAEIRRGRDWETEAQALFRGQGSFGNGSAMRIAPLGAYFADDLDLIPEQAARSAITTHSHAEAVAGAIAVAFAAGLAFHCKATRREHDAQEFLAQIHAKTPESKVKEGIRKAIELPKETSVEKAVFALGNGTLITCQDTVPFALWCAANYLQNYEEALWATVRGLGDRDTTCAIVGGIVIGYSGVDAVPKEWLESREHLPANV
jgi:ADP-ribosylglycohydrolase